MKTMRLGKYFLSLGIMAFLLFSTGNAFGFIAPNANCDNGASSSKPVGCIAANNFLVMSPYWQVDAGSYTFIAVTHSSLSGMASQIGLHVEALKSDGVEYDSAATFTIAAGSTKRVFIVPSSHSTINETAIPTAKFLAGTSDYTYGSVRVTPVMTHPELKWAQNLQSHVGSGFRDITMLSYWGSVIIEANSTGFAMEFLGDVNDSIALPQQGDCFQSKDLKQVDQNCGGTATYQSMSTGPNIQ